MSTPPANAWQAGTTGRLSRYVWMFIPGLLAAIAAVLAATVVRLAFLQALGVRATYITFYPAVILAALYGGLRAGVLTTILSAVVAGYFWIEPVNRFDIAAPADWLSLGIFVGSGVLVSWITERMFRANERSAAAEAEARAAAVRAEAAEALREAEQATRRQNAVLAGINRVLGSSLTCRTEEELGRTCLEVAEEITQSKLGFIGELNESGLQDIAISNPGWDACTALDPHGNRRPPGSFKIHGLYGRVLSEGKSLLTNNPPEHAGSIGLPEGHPPLTAFLGVPLKLAGRTIGMIAVGNREGGYVVEQQEALEGLAAAVVTAFERKRAEEKVRASHERMERVLEVETVGVMFWDLTTGRMTDANDTFLKMMGYSRHDVEAGELTWQKLTPPEYLEVSRAEIRKFMATGRVGPYEKEYFRKDGTRQWLVFAGSSLGNQACVEFCVDISARKNAEAALRESEELFRVIFTESSVGKAQADPRTGRFLRVNKALCGITGYSEEELLQRSFSEITHPEERSADFDRFQALVHGEVDSYDCEKRYVRPDGNTRWAHVTVNLIRDAEGQPRRSIAVIQDITERKQAAEALRASEERFRVAQELSPDGFSILRPVRDEQGRVVDFTFVYENATTGRVTGTDPRTVAGKSLLALFPRHRGTEILKAYLEVAEGGERRVLEAQYGAETVTPTWFRLAVVPLGNDIAVLAQDITRQREFQAELQRLVDERTARLQELVGELEHFSYTITHDMRAPLRAMRGFSDLISLTCEDCERKEPKDLLRRITTSGERMDRLITDALNYSRSVRQELPLENVDSGALLRGMLDTYPEFQATKARIQVEGVLPTVLGNQAGLTQVFSNLLGNAVKFVKPGEVPEIRIRAEVREGLEGRALAPAEAAVGRRGEGWVRFWVEDQGIGISKGMLPRVFDMFSRGSNSHEGTGIGLALARKVTQRMGGRIGVESEEGKGSRFWLELRPGERL